MSCVRPGIASTSLCIPLPPVDPLPEVEEPAAAIPARGVAIGDVWVVGLKVAAAKGIEVVVVKGAVVGATAREVLELFVVVVELVVVVSFVWRVVLSLVVVEGVEPVGPGEYSDVDDGICTSAAVDCCGFLISLCGLRIESLLSFVVDEVLALVRMSVVWV